MGLLGWNASIFSARESNDENEELVEDPDGNYRYTQSGTYGQSDFTVRERETDDEDEKKIYDVYIESDSEKEHSHSVIDEDGNILETYHEFKYLEANLELLKSVRKILTENENEHKLCKRIKN